MLDLLPFPPGAGLTIVSPFCTKVEVFLRLAGVASILVGAEPGPIDATP